MVLPVGLRISDSGNSSKFEVSSMLLISIDIAAGLSLPRTDRPKITMVSNHTHHNESSVSPQRDPRCDKGRLSTGRQRLFSVKSYDNDQPRQLTTSKQNKLH